MCKIKILVLFGWVATFWSPFLIFSPSSFSQSWLFFDLGDTFLKLKIKCDFLRSGPSLFQAKATFSISTSSFLFYWSELFYFRARFFSFPRSFLFFSPLKKINLNLNPLQSPIKRKNPPTTHFLITKVLSNLKNINTPK